MEYTDDEQVEKLKAWWKSYGTALVVGVMIGLGVLYGGRYWNQLQLEKAAQASTLFDQFVLHVQNNDETNIKQVGSRIVEEYDRTPYAGLTALILAKKSYESKDVGRAKKQLVWAIDNAREEGVRHVAAIRLARIQLAENNVAGAEALIQNGPLTGFEFEYYELLGDIARQKNDREAARQAYEKAISHSGEVGSYATVLRMKLDDLG